MNTYEFVNITAQIFPDREALVFEDRRADCAGLHQCGVTLAAGLRRLGVGPGQRMAVLDTNSDRYIQLFHATGFLGATFVPLNYRAKLDELSYLLNAAQPTLLCVGEQYYDLALAARPSAPTTSPAWKCSPTGRPRRPLACCSGLSTGSRRRSYGSFLFKNSTSRSRRMLLGTARPLSHCETAE